jgi:hypothetical protein
MFYWNGGSFSNSTISLIYYDWIVFFWIRAKAAPFDYIRFELFKSETEFKSHSRGEGRRGISGRRKGEGRVGQGAVLLVRGRWVIYIG